ncbi:MAG: NUDIX hydrolase [Ktedonobacteraceae bacterium]
MIVEDHGRFLLLKRPDGSLVFPGGFMRWREHPTQTALREIKEETGLLVTLHHVVACYSIASTNFRNMSTMILVFCAEVNGGDMRGSVEGTPFWIKESDLLEMVDFRYQYMLEDYREHRKQHGMQGSFGALVREINEENL